MSEETKEQRGFLVAAQNTRSIDYVRQAYALALSIKATNKQSSFAVMTDDEIPKKYRHAFDYVLPIPWSDQAKDSEWKIENRWKFPFVTPFDETIVMDTDMLLLSDISDWWDHFANWDVLFTSNVRTFRGNLVDKEVNRKFRRVFTSNDLPSIYSGFWYFKKRELVFEIMKTVELIFNHWEKVYDEYLYRDKPKYLSADVAYALAIKLLGIENKCINPIEGSLPSFVHMKSRIQNIKQSLVTNDWPQHFHWSLTKDLNLFIANYHQSYPFHYHVKDWLTDDKIKILEEAQ